jgi:hypothetical protein
MEGADQNENRFSPSNESTNTDCGRMGFPACGGDAVNGEECLFVYSLTVWPENSLTIENSNRKGLSLSPADAFSDGMPQKP